MRREHATAKRSCFRSLAHRLSLRNASIRPGFTQTFHPPSVIETSTFIVTPELSGRSRRAPAPSLFSRSLGVVANLNEARTERRSPQHPGGVVSGRPLVLRHGRPQSYKLCQN